MAVESHSSTQPVARTPLDDWHVRHGARITISDGWRLATGYSTVEQELAAARSGVGAVDVSAFPKLRLTGAAVATACGRLGPGAAKLQPGRVICRVADGDESIACLLADDHLLVLGTVAGKSGMQAWVRNPRGESGGVQCDDVTCALAGIHLFGAATDAILRRISLLDLSLSSFGPGSCADTNCDGVHATVVRSPDGADSGVRIYVAWDLGEYLWERLFDAGRQLGIAAVGIDAWRLKSQI